MWRLGLRTSVNSNGLSSGLSSHFAANAFRLLPIELVHVAQVAKLPLHHRDPFDRLLVAQALREKPAIVSADPIFRKYGARRLW